MLGSHRHRLTQVQGLGQVELEAEGVSASSEAVGAEEESEGAVAGAWTGFSPIIVGIRAVAGARAGAVFGVAGAGAGAGSRDTLLRSTTGRPLPPPPLPLPPSLSPAPPTIAGPTPATAPPPVPTRLELGYGAKPLSPSMKSNDSSAKSQSTLSSAPVATPWARAEEGKGR